MRLALFSFGLILAAAPAAAAQSTLYVAEYGNGQFSSATLSGTPPYTPTNFLTLTGATPTDVAVNPAGSTYVSYFQGGDAFIRQYDPAGSLVTGFGTGGTVSAGAGTASLMSLGASGTILTIENQGPITAPRLTRRDPTTGSLLSTFSLIRNSAGGVAQAPSGFVYVSAFASKN
jgi:hypothetical protein